MKSVFFKLSFIVIIIIALMILSPRQSLLSQKYDDESVFVNVFLSVVCENATYSSAIEEV